MSQANVCCKTMPVSSVLMWCDWDAFSYNTDCVYSLSCCRKKMKLKEYSIYRPLKVLVIIKISYISRQTSVSMQPASLTSHSLNITLMVLD